MPCEEPPDRPEPEGVAAPSKGKTQFLDGDVRRLIKQGPDQCGLCFDPSRASVSTKALGLRTASLTPESAPPTNARCTDAKTITGFPVAQTIINRSKDADSQIN